MTNPVTIKCFVGLLVGHKEVSAKEYHRVPVDWNFDTRKFRLYNSPVHFPMANGSWGAITHYALFRTKTGSKCYTKLRKLTKPAPPIKANENYCFPRGELVLKLKCIDKDNK